MVGLSFIFAVPPRDVSAGIVVMRRDSRARSLSSRPGDSGRQFCLNRIVGIGAEWRWRWVEIPTRTHQPPFRHFRLFISPHPWCCATPLTETWTSRLRQEIGEGRNPREPGRRGSRSSSFHSHTAADESQPTSSQHQRRGRFVSSSQKTELAQSPAVGPQANPGYTPSIGIISIKKCEEK